MSTLDVRGKFEQGSDIGEKDVRLATKRIGVHMHIRFLSE
jgi:hypothetical protein